MWGSIFQIKLFLLNFFCFYFIYRLLYDGESGDLVFREEGHTISFFYLSFTELGVLIFEKKDGASGWLES